MSDLLERIEGAEKGSLVDYECAICLHNVDTRFARHWRGAGQLRPPLCCRCEKEWGRPAKDGAFADRRTVAVGSALSEALANTAALRIWEGAR